MASEKKQGALAGKGHASEAQTSGKTSKTARASMRVGEGNAKRIPVAWIMRRIPGKMQTKPYATFFNLDAAKTFYATCDQEAAVFVHWGDVRR